MVFLARFSFGHVRQLDAVAARQLGGLAAATPLLPGTQGAVELAALMATARDRIRAGQQALDLPLESTPPIRA